MPKNQTRPRPGTTRTSPGKTRAAAGKTRNKAGKATRKLRNSGMSTNLKITLGVLAAALVAVLVVVAVNATSTTGAAASVVREDSHRLSTAADGKVTVVEFLDFECEACLAAYPGVERIRAEYGDRITYVVRYFPIASHPNAYTAAHAAEAAARQGKFEQMYVKLFDTQNTWGHQQQSQAAVFEGYARELGLDVDRFTADVASAEVAQRVRSDADDGTELGVSGTPTFFINGQKYDGNPTYDALKSTIDGLLAA